MRKVIRSRDAWLVGSPLAVAVQKVPATLVTADQGYLDAVAAMPDWFFPFTVGVALAVWLVDPWTDGSRLRQLWHWLTDSFVVERVHAGAGGDGPSDLHIAVWIRFRRRVRFAKVWLRVYSCTQMGRKPMEHVMLLEELGDVPKGFRKRVEIASFAFPIEGWDHTKKRGWGGGQENLISQSSNVAILEVQGMFLTQRYRMFVEQIEHVGNAFRPSLYVLGEGDDVFDVSENSPCRSGVRA